MTEETSKGLVIECDHQGLIVRVLRNDLGITKVAPGQLFFGIVDPNSRTKTMNFLTELKSQGSLLNWEINIPANGNIEVLHFAGGLVGESILITAATDGPLAERLYEDMLLITNEQSNIIRTALKDNQGMEDLPTDLMYIEISRLNNELGTMQRELAANNAELARLNQKLSQTNAELDAFSYSVSHDLHAPLRGIRGFAEIIAQDHRESLNEEGRRYVDNIVMAGERMEVLIDDLLKYSRLGRSSITLQTIELQEVFALIRLDVNERVTEMDAELIIPEQLPAVRGEMTLLLQIFTNLIVNALTYHKKDVAPRIQVDAKNENDHILVQIADNGIGIPAEMQEKIFEVFQRLHSTDVYPGTGIGLSIVKKSVELLNGNVRVVSTPDKGSTFYVSLPRG